MRLEGKVAIVTGAGSGIGRATALTFAREGADVVVNDIDLERANKVADEVKALGRDTIAIRADVSKKKEVDDMVKTTLEKFGRIDILVNNAGIGARGKPEELSEEAWDMAIKVNLYGTFFCSQAAGKVMIKQGKGKIISVSSLAGHRSHPRSSIPYNASKHGILGITKNLACEWGRHNINVNAVSPSITRTPMAASLTLERERDRVKRIPLGRIGEAQDVANAILFLASSEADYITGIAIPVDGGQWAMHGGVIMYPQEG